jgi:hypothetical protein
MKFDIYEDPLEFYEFLLLGPLTKVYRGKRLTEHKDFLNYSNLIVEKFAIHSLSYFHLSSGIIEQRLSTEKIKMTGYDLFSVNSLLRTMIENYATFNHLFIEAKTYEEQKFRFLLWKIDGLHDKSKFDIRETDYQEATETLNKDKETLQKTIEELEASIFYSTLHSDQLKKIYDPINKKYCWRFLINDTLRIKPLKITELVNHTCKTRAFINTYKYSSIHTHTNYLSIEHFEKVRGKQISTEYTNPLTRLAIYLTCLMICDICSLDKNGENEYNKLPTKIKAFITGMSNTIRNE